MENAQKDRYFSELGKIAAYTNALERQIFKFIQQVSGLDKNTSYLVFAGEQAEVLLKFFDVIVRLRLTTDPALSEFNSLRKNIGQAFEARNQYLHSTWTFPNNSEIAIRSKMERKDLGKFAKAVNEPVPLKHLESCSNNVMSATFRLLDFCYKNFPKNKK